LSTRFRIFWRIFDGLPIFILSQTFQQIADNVRQAIIRTDDEMGKKPLEIEHQATSSPWKTPMTVFPALSGLRVCALYLSI